MSHKLAELTEKLWPRAHGRFEEMCVLAATGQLGGPQMCELNDHVAGCKRCREFLESVSETSVEAALILAARKRGGESAAVSEGMRERFLTRLSAEDLDAGVESSSRPHLVHVQRVVRLPLADRPPETSVRARRTARSAWRSALGVAACAVIVAGVSLYVVWHQPVTQHSFERPVVVTKLVQSDSGRVKELEDERQSLEVRLGDLESRLGTSEADNRTLSEKLATANDQLAELRAREQTQQSAAQDAQSAKSQVAILETEVDKLRFSLDESKENLTAARTEAQTLQAKLEDTNAELRREADLRDARSQIGELVAARNLHIVDVYDADSAGKRQRAFGRVFYTEGKSLVFYAYDLEDSRHVNANVVFHVWGEKAGAKETTHSLGILHNDDAGQGRWALTFDDPGVLAQINSVYVTAESGNKQTDAPRGKKVLYAYFGSAPNHP